MSPSIISLAPQQAEAQRAALVDLLVDAVDNGASVNFVQPMTRQKSDAWWSGAIASLWRGERVLFGAFDGETLVGSVQLIFPGQENQGHRADIGKLLVHSTARRRGIGTALMQAAEAEAVARGRVLLVLDTETGSDGDRLYSRLGWTPFGTVPGYAMTADGSRLAECSFYYKSLS